MPNAVVETGQTELKSLNEDGSPPKSRVTSATAVRNMYERALRFNSLRSRRNSLVKGIVDGNPPFNDSQLAKNAQRYRSNFNNGEAESYLNVALTAFYDLFSEVETHATVGVDSRNPKSHEWSEKVTRHFEWLQEQDEDFDYNIQLSQHDMVLYGAGPQLWEDARDWRSRPIRFQDMLLPRRAESNPTRWEWVDVSYEFTVSQLYEFISDETAARKAGWNVEAVKRSIMLSGQGLGSGDPNSPDWQKWESWQQALRNNDLWMGERCRVITVIRTLYKEFPRDGEPAKISEAWVDKGDTDHDDFLYQKVNAFDGMKQAICPFFYDRGDGTAHSVRGLGVKMYKLLVTKMRLQNAGVDAAFARGAIMLKAMGGGAGQQQVALTHLGPYTVLPAGFDFVPNVAVPGVSDAFMITARDLDNTLSSNLSQYRNKIEKPDGNPRTAFEISQSVQQASALARTQISRYYEQLDDWYSERFRRAANSEIPRSTTNKWLKLALEFQRRCAEDGVPSAALQKASVKATRAVGQGSAIVRLQMLTMVLNTAYQALPESGKQNIIRDLVASAVGRGYVERYAGFEIVTAAEQQDRWQAQQENNDFADGGVSTITETQNDVWHLDEHFSFVNNAAASLQEGADMAKVWVTLETSGKHMAQHIQRLAGDPRRKPQVDFFQRELVKMSQLAAQLGDALKKQAEEQAAQAQAQAQSDPEIAIKAQKEQANLELKKVKQDATLAMKQQKQEADQAMKIQQQQFNQALADAKAGAEIKRKDKESKQKPK